MATFKSSARHCCVPGCVTDDRYDQNINFHKIPKKEQLRKQWIIRIRRDEGPFFKITDSTVVCSNHFERQDYKWTPLRKTLKPGSVPSVFNWTPKKEPRRLLKRKLLAPTSKSVQQSAYRDVESTETERVMTAQTSEPMESEKTEEVKYKELHEQKQKECEDLKQKIAFDR